MPEKKALSQRENEILGIGLTCLDHAGIDFNMMAERAGYKNANSAREGFRNSKKRFLAVVGINPKTGIPKESVSSTASASTRDTSAMAKPARAATTATLSRAVPVRAAIAKVTSVKATPARADSATTPLSRAKSTRASSTRTVPAKRARRDAATSPPPSGEEEYGSDDTKDEDDVVEADDEEDYKPPGPRYPLAKKAKTSVKTKASKDDAEAAVPPKQPGEHDNHGEGEANTHGNKPEESSAMFLVPHVEPKEQDRMGDGKACEDVHALDEKSKEEHSAVMPIYNAETQEQNSMDANDTAEAAHAWKVKLKEETRAVILTHHVDNNPQDNVDDPNAGEDVQASDAMPKNAGDVAMAQNIDAEEDGEAMDIAGKPKPKATQAHQSVDPQTGGMRPEMDVTGETKENAVAGSGKGVNKKNTAAVSAYDSKMEGGTAEPQSGEAANAGVLDEMANILMQAAALEKQMKADEELAPKESKA